MYLRASDSCFLRSGRLVSGGTSTRSCSASSVNRMAARGINKFKVVMMISLVVVMAYWELQNKPFCMVRQS